MKVMGVTSYSLLDIDLLHGRYFISGVVNPVKSPGPVILLALEEGNLLLLCQMVIL